MSDNLHALWVEKYRPKTLDDYIFQSNTQRSAIETMVKDMSVPHLLLSGVQGTGKTTLAFILATKLDLDETDIMIVNASDENSVDVMRDKIKNFVQTFAMSKFKLVIMEEADYITPAGQAVLRRMMEEYCDQARFILTCNYEHRIIPAIHSRCQHFRFKAFDRDDVATRIVTILASEQVKFTLDLVDSYVSVGYPDIRKIINLLQQNTVGGELQPPQSTSDASDYKFKLLELIERDKWNDIRTLLCGNVVAEEWEDVYRFLYENINKCPKFESTQKWEEGIVVINKFLTHHTSHADPEINAAAMFIELKHL